jgi:phage terminase small subunit
MRKTSKRAPSHLSQSSRRWWLDVVNTWELDPHHLHLLSAAASALDRAEEARQTLAKEGSYFVNRHGESKPHPAIACERDSRVLFARLLRELDLDAVPAPQDKRPPSLRRYGGN